MMRSATILILALLLYACNTPPAYEVIDGVLEVPENRKDPNSRTLKLVYKVLKARKADSTKAPIVYLQGGPGAPTLIMEEFWKNNPLRNDRDIILMDQRGTGASEANCIEIGEAMFAVARQDLDTEGEIKALNAILSQCKETMNQDGVDLAGYTSKENAADFEDLRKALGYEKWNLFGSSYGSRLGLTIMRDFPDAVRSAILTGIFGPEVDYFGGLLINFENALFTVLSRCANNEDCNNRYPNLKERLLKALKKLESEPLQFDFEGEPFVLNPQDAVTILFTLMYERSFMGYIPLIIEALEHQKPQIIAGSLNTLQYLFTVANWPMNYSIMAYEELPFFNELAAAEALKNSEFKTIFTLPADPGMDTFGNWHPYRASEIENQAVVSDIPTLMASAGLDHVTPVSNAKETIKHLKNGYEVVIQDEGHGSLATPCFYQIAEDFLNNPGQKPDIACSADREKIPWSIQPVRDK